MNILNSNNSRILIIYSILIITFFLGVQSCRTLENYRNHQMQYTIEDIDSNFFKDFILFFVKDYKNNNILILSKKDTNILNLRLYKNKLQIIKIGESYDFNIKENDSLKVLEPNIEIRSSNKIIYTPEK